MDKGRFLIETHLRTGRPIGELARAYGMNPSWLYQRLARYRREGEPGLEPRSRRPMSSPARICDLYEDQIVALRKELTDGGFDAGAETIHTHLARRHRVVPSAVDHLAGPQGPRLRHPPAPQAARSPRGPAFAPSSPTSAGRATSPTSRWQTGWSSRSSTSSTTIPDCVWPAGSSSPPARPTWCGPCTERPRPGAIPSGS